MPTPSLDRNREVWKKPREDSSYQWVASLPALFAQHRLDVVAEQTINLGDRYRAMFNQNDLAGYEDFVEEAVLGVQAGEEMRRYTAALEAEMRSGAGIEVPWSCVVDRKRGEGMEGGSGG
ncbi:MAG: hypothetical protein LQ340_005998 [Diploschistes diacapsis]|nr:MAG: hypothetical protein LQ340_005998 [Diploschistes diacapsis]